MQGQSSIQSGLRLSSETGKTRADEAQPLLWLFLLRCVCIPIQAPADSSEKTVAKDPTPAQHSVVCGPLPFPLALVLRYRL